jgi:hypothetical protein
MNATVALTLTVTSKRVVKVPGRLTPAEMIERVEGYDGYNLNSLAYADHDKATVDLDNIEGLPEPPVETPAAQETVESILNEVETMKATVRQWVIDQQHRWCESGINEAFGQVDLEQLPTQRHWTLTRRLAGNDGTATVVVTAYTEDEAKERANWDNAEIDWDNVPALADEILAESD